MHLTMSAIRFVDRCFFGKAMAASLIAGVVFSFVVCSVASGIDILVEKKESPPKLDERNLGNALERFVDRQLYGTHKNAEGLEKHLKNRLAVRIRKTTAEWNLDRAQVQAIELAGQGDIQVFMRDCNLVRNVWKPNRQNLHQIVHKIQPLQKRMTTGIHEEGSMFARTFLASLGSEQEERIFRRKEQLSESLLQAKVRLFVVEIDSIMPMDQERREGLTTFLEKNVRLPEQEIDSRMQKMMSWYILYQTSKLPPARLEEFQSFFHEDDWPQIEAQLKSSRRMEIQFEQAGMKLNE